MDNRFIIDGVDVTEELRDIVNKKRGTTPNQTVGHKDWQCTCNVLRLVDLNANIEIQPGTSKTTKIDVTGPSDALERIAVDAQNGVATIRGMGGQASRVVQFNSGGSSFNFMGGRGTVISMGRNTIITNNGMDTEKIDIKITAPKHIEIEADISGNLTIGDLECVLTADVSNVGILEAASVTDLDIDASGNYRVVINRILGGNVNVDLSGACSVQISDGHVSKLSVDTSGASQFTANIVAERANLDASGASFIKVKSVTGRCHKDHSGVSRILVG